MCVGETEILSILKTLSFDYFTVKSPNISPSWFSMASARKRINNLMRMLYRIPGWVKILTEPEAIGVDSGIWQGEETLRAVQTSTKATVVAIHMEALSFCPVSRKKLRNMASNETISVSRLIIPEDGETLSLS